MDEATFRELLAQERVTSVLHLGDLEASLASIIEDAEEGSHDDEHDPDGSTVAFERAQVAALAERARSRMRELDDADKRLADHTYGLCEMCGTAISRDRLLALPLTRTCIVCTALV